MNLYKYNIKFDSKIIGIVFHISSFFILFLILLLIDKYNYINNSNSIIFNKDVYYFFLLYFITSFMGYIFLKSHSIIGYSYYILSILVFILILLGFKSNSNDELFKVLYNRLNLIIFVIILNIIGSIFLRIGKIDTWRWWIFIFLPCSLLTLFFIIISSYIYYISTLLNIWIWYFAICSLPDWKTSKKYLKNIVVLLFLVLFTLILFNNIRSLIFIQHSNKQILEIYKNIKNENIYYDNSNIKNQINNLIYLCISSFISLILIIIKIFGVNRPKVFKNILTMYCKTG